jgi:ferredoxin-NADP reductase
LGRLDQRRQSGVAGTAVLGRLTWLATEVAGAVNETPRVRTLELDTPGWAGHRAGQHLDVRLTAEDGYQAQRSYSIASAPGDPLTITVERLEDGEVSPYLVGEAREGDAFEVRGPIGGYFVWDGDEPGPVLLVGGGSGVVPLMAMARHRAQVGSQTPMRLLYSSRTWDDVIYRDELGALADGGFEVVHTLTREQPPGWSGYARRIDRELLSEVAFPAAERPRVYVCGSTRFVDAAADGLIELGYDPMWVRTERFGATG